MAVRKTNAILILIILFCCATTFAQFQSGNIYGRTQAKDGSALPGVTVTLTGVGAPQTTLSDAQGNFRFINLSPGSYSLKAELAGYGSATRAGVGVRIGANSDVTMNLNPSVSESITVTAEAPLLDVRKAGTAVNVTKVEMEKIPTSRDPWTILQSVPAVQVDRINVGGSQSGQQSNYYAKNALVTDNTWNVDGVNITDMGATGSSPTYYDFDAFEEMQVTTGGSDPRIMTPGVQLNLVTKRGTNELKGSGRYLYTPGSFQADATVPSEATPYLATTNRINFVRDYGAEVGGAIWKDHLWGWIARGDQKISTQASTAIDSGSAVPGAFDNIVLRNTNAKLNAQIAASNSFVAFYNLGDKVRNARNLSTERPFEAAWRQTGPTKVYKLEDTQIFGSSFYLTGMWSKVSGGFSLIPNGGLDTNAFKDANSVWHDSYNFFITDRPQKQYRLDGSKFLEVGSMNHEFKFGFGYRNTPVSSASGWPGSTKGYWDASTFSANDCADMGLPSNCMLAWLNRDAVKGYDEKYNDAYIGDTLLVGNLTIQAGLRYDLQKTHNIATTAQANPVLATPLTLPCVPISAGGFCSGTYDANLGTLAYPGDARTLKWTSVTPRIGLTYALGSDKKTLLRAAYNRYVSQIGATIGAANPIGYYQYLEIAGVDTNGDRIVQRNELLKVYGFNYIDPAAPNSVVPTTRTDYGMKAPTTDEVIIGAEREFFTDFSVGVNYSYRKYNDLIAVRREKTQGGNDWYTPSDFIPLVRDGQPVMAGGTFSANGHTFTTPLVPVYTLAPNVPDPTFGVLTNLPGYSASYNGLEVTATKRLSHNWMMRGNVSYNDQKTNCSSEALPNPTPSIYTTLIGSLPIGTLGCVGGESFQRSANSGAFQNVFISSTWSANLTGLVQLPADFALGASLSARQGYPAVLRDRISRTKGGVTDVVLNSVGDVRFDNVYELDLRASKDFRFFNRVGLTLSADLFNAPNQRTVLQRDTRLMSNGAPRSTGYRITEMQSPRAWRFGAHFTF